MLVCTRLHLFIAGPKHIDQPLFLVRQCPFQYGAVFLDAGITKIKRSSGRFIFIVRIYIPANPVFIMKETGLRCFFSKITVLWCIYPSYTICNNDVVITTIRRHFDVITSKWRRFDVITMLLLRHVLGGYKDHKRGAWLMFLIPSAPSHYLKQCCYQ